MISGRRVSANQRNAKLSTGPRTQAGKARSAKNALGHGLSIPITRDPIGRLHVEHLARILSGPSNNLRSYEHAYMLAESCLELRRIRAAQSEVLAALAGAQTAIQSIELARAAAKIGRYERRIRSKRKKALAEYRQDDEVLKEVFS